MMSAWPHEKSASEPAFDQLPETGGSEGVIFAFDEEALEETKSSVDRHAVEKGHALKDLFFLGM